MKIRKILRFSAFIISTIVSVFSIVFLLSLTFNLPSQGFYKGQNTSTKTGIGIPLRLKIPSIDIDANIKSLGLTPKGAMDVNKGPYDVTRFKLGKRPGQTGSAVIAGHYGIWKNGDISVFNRLHELQKGDKISIIDDKGKTTSFVVRESKKYKLDANTSSVFTSQDEKSHLNLITCVWDKISKSYSKRLVVFADKI